MRHADAHARASNRRLAKDTRSDTHSRAGTNRGPLAPVMHTYAVVTELAKRSWRRRRSITHKHEPPRPAHPGEAETD
eukprot:11724258-Alexandrium_andersonii.AAC.1